MRLLIPGARIRAGITDLDTSQTHEPRHRRMPSHRTTASSMTQTPPDIHIPSGSTISVKLVNPVSFGPSHIKRFMEPPIDGLDTFESVPSLCFLLEHPSGRKLVWDLGIRKDYTNYATKIAEYIPTTGYSIDVTKNMSEILEDGGVRLEEIEAVIWRYVRPDRQISITESDGETNESQPLALGSHR